MSETLPLPHVTTWRSLEFPLYCVLSTTLLGGFVAMFVDPVPPEQMGSWLLSASGLLTLAVVLRLKIALMTWRSTVLSECYVTWSIVLGGLLFFAAVGILLAPRLFGATMPQQMFLSFVLVGLTPEPVRGVAAIVHNDPRHESQP